MQLTSPMPPAVYVQQRVGAQLESLGGTIVNSDTDFSAAEVRFADPHMVEVANGAFSDTIDGLKVLYRDSNGNGVRGFATGYAVVDAVSKMEGVTKAMALESFPMQLAFETTPDAKAAVEMLLRDETPAGESISVR